MKAKTKILWDKLYNSVGNRLGLFTAVAEASDAQSVLYPRSFDLLVSLYAGFVSESCTRFLHEWGRGIGYTKSPFAYRFTRIA